MGMFGKRLLNQVGMNLLGVDYLGEQAKREREAERQKFTNELGTLLLPGYTPGAAPQVGLNGEGNTDTWQYEAPTRTREPLNANSPDLASLAFKASQMGVPIDKLLDVLKTQQPNVQYDRGFGYNQKTGDAMGGYHPNLGEGQTLGPGGAVANLPGYVAATAETAGATTGAQEKAKAQLDVIPVNMPDGTTIQMPRDVAVQAILQSLAGGGSGGVGRSRAPEAASAAKIIGDATAEASVALPNSIATSQGALELIDKLKKHPGLANRTGLTAIVPAIPGTAGADFDTMAEQLKGKVFLEAFQSLKGGGAITEREGQAAQAAIARLNERQSEAGYRSALADLERVVKSGMARQQQKASGAQRSPAVAKPAANLKAIPLQDRLAEARRRGLIQ